MHEVLGGAGLQPCIGALQFYMFSMVETRLAASEDGASPVSTRVHKIPFSAACLAAEGHWFGGVMKHLRGSKPAVFSLL